MNVFGGATGMNFGPRGPRGIRGKDGSFIDFCNWLPQSLIGNLQSYDEKCCFIIRNPEKDLLRKGSEIKEWISRSHFNLNLVAEKASSDIEQILENRYVINFKKNRYTSNLLTLIENTPQTYGFLCVTFRVTADKDQVVLSNYQEHHERYCEIKVTVNEIYIHAHTATEIIQHPSKEWTTLFIEHNSDDKITHYRYDVNGQTGSFTAPVSDMVHCGFALGSRWNNTYFLDGQIAALEIYSISNSASLPESVKKVVIKNQSIVDL